MGLAYLLDENILRLWRAVQHYNARGEHVLDVVRVGDPPDLPLGSVDQVILPWAERENRILITRDWNSLGEHLMDHWNAGGHTPGIFMVRNPHNFRAALEFMVIAAAASEAEDWRDRVEFIA